MSTTLPGHVPSSPPQPPPRPAVERLAGRIDGSVLSPDADGYEVECAGFNEVAVHRPAVVVTATGPSDVRDAVLFGAEHGMPIAVQATGHGIVAPLDGGLLVSTRRMKGVRIDPESASARIGAGVRWYEVIQAAAPYGLAPLSGSSPLVGVVGYTLGGGLGLLGREWGYAADHVRAVELVTADGTLRRATPDVHPDLFWAVRGGKGNFGVVTEIEIGLVPVRRVYGGGLYFPGDRAADVLHAWRRWTETVPATMTSSLALLRLPCAPSVPEFLRGRLTVHVRISYHGAADGGDRLLRPLRELGPARDTVVELPYTETAEIHHDPVDPLPYHERSTMLRFFDESAVDHLLDLAGPEGGYADLMVELRHLGAALGKSPAVPNAVGNRDAAFSLSTLSAPDPCAPGNRDPLVDRMASWSTGGRYLNFLGGPTTAEQARQAYSAPTYRRLAAIKAVYDPANLFRANHNIAPSPELDR